MNCDSIIGLWSSINELWSSLSGELPDSTRIVELHDSRIMELHDWSWNYLLIHSFIHSLTHSFIHPFIHFLSVQVLHPFSLTGMNSPSISRAQTAGVSLAGHWCQQTRMLLLSWATTQVRSHAPELHVCAGAHWHAGMEFRVDGPEIWNTAMFTVCLWRLNHDLCLKLCTEDYLICIFHIFTH